MIMARADIYPCCWSDNARKERKMNKEGEKQGAEGDMIPENELKRELTGSIIIEHILHMAEVHSVQRSTALLLYVAFDSI